jgi:hypothetical protein
VSFTAGPNGFGIWKLTPKGWARLPGEAMRIAQHPVTGALTVVNVRGEIWRSPKGDGSDWGKLTGSAVDVSDGPQGLVVVGTDPA